MMNNNIRVCHLSSAHYQEDMRIFHKECISLSKAGYDVYLVSCGRRYEKEGVHLEGVGPRVNGRTRRIFIIANKVYMAAKKIDADVYHIHDPELMIHGLLLKLKGKKVIFDSHEDIPAQIMSKEYIFKPFRKIVAVLYKVFETFFLNRIDAAVAATPYIAEKFKGRAHRIFVINNFPRIDEITFHDKNFGEREAIICYAGCINEMRGEKNMIKSMEGVDGRLLLAGDKDKSFHSSKVEYLGFLNRSEIDDLYGRSIAGLCVLKPTLNYYNSQPIKLFEYMAAGLPFVCSDFPMMKRIVAESGAGICVDPESVDEIRKAITYLLNNRNDAQKMGRRGYEYVIKQCTWTNEEKKLIDLYHEIVR